MARRFKVGFATGSRADYGIVRRYISLLNADPNVEFSVLVTGALLDSRYGNAVDIIKKDGFNISYSCPVDLKNDKLSDTTNIMAEVLREFSLHFENNHYDLMIILGDRYEIFSVSLACAMQRIPILHLHGGEVTISNYDEFIRHSITKMSRFHFTSTEEYRNRVIQLGEEPDTVFYLGALGSENCLSIDMDNVDSSLLSLEEKKCFCVLFHPETLNTQSPADQIDEVLAAISKYIDHYKFVFIGSNADTSANLIKIKVKDFCLANENAIYHENLHPDGYHYLVKKSIALVGNSSSGIIEAPSLGSYTINIGTRQTGRVKGNSIIDVPCLQADIEKAIEHCINSDCNNIVNPYYVKNSAQKQYEKTCEILNKLDSLTYKPFYDIPKV